MRTLPFVSTQLNTYDKPPHYSTRTAQTGNVKNALDLICSIHLYSGLIC